MGYSPYRVLRILYLRGKFTKHQCAMAKLIPHRPKYRDRSLPIYYVMHGEFFLRSRPTSVRDPRSPAQLLQRLRMRVASHFLAGFRPVVELGFAPRILENYRRVGGYQQALGHLLTNGLITRADSVSLVPEKVLLSEGRESPLGAVRVAVVGRQMEIGWTGALPVRNEMMLIGIWNRTEGKARCELEPCSADMKSLALNLPKGWNRAYLDVWIAPWKPGEKGRFNSTYAAVSPVKIPAGVVRNTHPDSAESKRHAEDASACVSGADTTGRVPDSKGVASTPQHHNPHIPPVPSLRLADVGGARGPVTRYISKPMRYRRLRADFFSGRRE